MAPLDWIRVHLPLNPAPSPASLDDPEYLKLYRQYLASLEDFVREVKVAISLAVKKDLPGPRRQVDFGRLNMLRRFYERDAYRYFSYRPHIRGPLPPDIARSRARGHTKDAAGAQLLGDAQRAESDLKRGQENIEALCAEVRDRYQKAPRPPGEDLIRELVAVLALAQSAGHESPVVEQMQKAVGELGDTGRHF